MAGRAQSHGAYHGPVDAVRRAAQREAYADLYRSARQFIDAWEKAEEVMRQVPWSERSDHPPEVHALLREMHEAQDALERAADMVRLEGPENLAKIADRIWGSAVRLGGQRLGPKRTSIDCG